MVDLPAVAPWPLPILVFVLLILLPGLALASAVLAGRRVEAALLVLLAIVLGLVSVSGTAYLWVALSNQHLSLPALAVPSVVYFLAGGFFWRRGKRPDVVGTPLPVWLLLGAVALFVFITHDASVLTEAAEHWVQAGRGNCFRMGTFQYLGLPSPVWQKTMPPLMGYWDGIMPGNLALSSLYTLIFGWPGFRLLRVTMVLVMALQGYLLGKRYSSKPLGGYLGLAVFALNPFMLLVQDTDRNVMALAFGSLLFLLLVLEIGGPILLGILAGFTAGLGLQMMPLLYLIPVAWHLWQRNRRPWPVAAFVLLGGGVAALWLLRIGWYDPGPLNPLHVYDLGFFEVRLQYVLGFPFYPELTSGPFSTYPTLLTLAFYLANTLGVVLVGLAVIGWSRLALSRRPELLTLLLFGIPPLLILGLMVRIVPDQLRLAIPSLLPCLVGVVAGSIWLVSGSLTRHRLVLMGAATVVPFLVVMALAQVRVPEDPRFEHILPPNGADPIAEYMTDEARLRLGMGEGAEPPAGPPPITLGGSTERSSRLEPFFWPTLLPNYTDRHPLERDDQDRWADIFKNRSK